MLNLCSLAILYVEHKSIAKEQYAILIEYKIIHVLCDWIPVSGNNKDLRKIVL